MAAGTHPALAALLELERQDGALAAALTEAVRLDEGAAAVGERAAAVAALLEAAPVEEARLAAALAVAQRDAGETRTAAEEAAARAAAATERKAKDAPVLQRDAQQAADAARAAADAEARARTALQRQHDEAEAARLEAPLVEHRAAALAADLARLPRLSASGARPPAPGAGLAGVVEWRPRARAALLIVQGALARERESVLRDAAETATAAAPDTVAAPTVKAMRIQLERAVGS